MSYKDASGIVFTTSDGKPPSAANIPVTIEDGTGKVNNGTWNGTSAVPNNK